MASLMDQIAELESIESLDDVWFQFEKIARQMGFTYVTYTMASSVSSEYYYHDNTGTHKNNEPAFYDPFLEYCCHNYEVTYTGPDFVDDYPYLSEEAVALIKQGAQSGFVSGVGVPVRLIGSNRYGGFNLGTPLPRQEFLNRFSGEVDTVRLCCVMIQRHIETLMDNFNILCDQSQNNIPAKENIQMGLLTEREREIMVYIANGMSRKSCAETLSLSEGTISTHIKNIYRKLGVHNKVDAVRAVT